MLKQEDGILGSGIWDSGIWDLGPGSGPLEPGSGPLEPGSGLWSLDLVSEALVLDLVSEALVLDLVSDSGFWNVLNTAAGRGLLTEHVKTGQDGSGMGGPGRVRKGRVWEVQDGSGHGLPVPPWVHLPVLPWLVHPGYTLRFITAASSVCARRTKSCRAALKGLF